MSVRESLLLVVLVGGAFQAFGACGDDPANLMQFSNCGFDLNTSGWTLIDGDLFVQHPGEGYSELGAAYVDPKYYDVLTRYEFQLDGPCVSVLKFTEYEIGGYGKSFGNMTCFVSLFEYSGASCTGWLAGCGGPGHTSFGGWTLVENSCTTTATTQSARLHFYCQNSSLFQALLDDAFIVKYVPPIFEDDFENGNTLAWTATVP